MGAFTTATLSASRNDNKAVPAARKLDHTSLSTESFIPFHLPTVEGGSSHHNPVNSVTTISWPRDLAMYIKWRMRQRIRDMEEQCSQPLLRQQRPSRRAKHPTNLEQCQLTVH
jgi:hypothetical protein